MPGVSICFVGYNSLSILAREYNHRGAGGEEVQQTLLAKAFARHGYRTSMVVMDYGQPDGATWDGVTTYKAFDAAAGIPVLRYLHPRWSGLSAALKRANAGVYYVSHAGGHVGQVVLFAKRHNRKVIFRIAHDANCDPSKVMLKYWRDRKLYEYGLRRADVIIAQTELQQRMLLENYGLQSRLATMLVEAPENYRLLKQRDIPVLWVNNLRRFKRPDLLLELAQQMPAVEMHMVGSSVPGFEDVHKDVNERGASLPNFTYHGRVPYHDVNDLYERARVFVNTSDTEGFPNSYLQAWARGTPVVAFFDPDGVIAKEGLGTRVGSMAEMRIAVTRLLSEPEHWTAASLRCKAFMEREYGDNHVLPPYVAEVNRLSAALNQPP